MLYPTINDLTKGQFNRYELSLATAKCARIVTDEYVKQREAAEAEKSQAGNKENDRPLTVMINKELRDEKAVKTAIKRIHEGDYVIVRRPEGYVFETVKEEEKIEEPIDFKAMFAEKDADEDDEAIED